MIIRQLVTRFGVEFDKASAVRAKGEANTVLTALKNLGTGLIIGGLARATMGLTNMASEVVETSNVLDVAFRENAENVKQWAETYGAAVGRSKYYLQKVAADVGAIMTPMLNNDYEKSTQIAKRFGELMTDLGSLYNKDDLREVLIAQKAGLTGEMEPLKKFGVAMTQAALQEYAHEKGIRKKIRTMKEAEKAELRANFIIEKTYIAHGDALKTAGEYENVLKRLKGTLHELGVEVGFKLIPGMKWLANAATRVSTFFKELNRETYFLEAAATVLGLAVARMGWKFLKWAAPIGKWAPIIALLVLAIEDLYTWLNGGDSVIGDFINLLWGPGSAQEAAEALKGTFKEMGPVIANAMRSARQALKEFVSWIRADFMPGITDDFLNLRYNVESVFKNIEYQIDRISIGIQMMIKGVAMAWESLKVSLGTGSTFRLGNYQREVEALGARIAKLQKQSALYNTTSGMVQMRARGALGVANNVINQRIVVNATGVGPALAQSVADATGKEVWNQNRATLNALKQQGQ